MKESTKELLLGLHCYKALVLDTLMDRHKELPTRTFRKMMADVFRELNKEEGKEAVRGRLLRTGQVEGAPTRSILKMSTQRLITGLVDMENKLGEALLAKDPDICLIQARKKLAGAFKAARAVYGSKAVRTKIEVCGILL